MKNEIEVELNISRYSTGIRLQFLFWERKKSQSTDEVRRISVRCDRTMVTGAVSTI